MAEMRPSLAALEVFAEFFAGPDLISELAASLQPALGVARFDLECVAFADSGQLDYWM